MKIFLLCFLTYCFNAIPQPEIFEETPESPQDTALQTANPAPATTAKGQLNIGKNDTQNKTKRS